MANFGFNDLRIVNPFMPSWEDAHAAIKAENIINNARLFSSLEEAVKDRNLVFALTCLDKRRAKIKDIVPLPQINGYLNNNYGTFKNIDAAIVFGQEKRGLTNEEISLSNAVINIPTAKEQPSMNLAQAVTVCCYEFSKLTARNCPQKHFLKPAAVADIVKESGEINAIFETIKFESNLSREQRLLFLQERLMAAKISEESLKYINKFILRLKKYL